jgi:hypothetical protein
MSDFDPFDLPILPRRNGLEWPSCRGWTDAERLELRDMQLEQALTDRDEAAAVAQELFETLCEEWYGRSSPWAYIEELEAKCPWLKRP